MTPGHRIREAILASSARGRPALIPFITAGYPERGTFRQLLRTIAPCAAAIEVGVPFTDPMADGITVQRSSRRALEQGVTLPWILEELRQLRTESPDFATPIILMGYLNPFLSVGLAELAGQCAADGGAGVDALIVPDLPLEEAVTPGGLREQLHSRGVGLVQLVSPVTPSARAARIAAASDGFLYAVTTTGITGSNAPAAGAADYLERLRNAIGGHQIPICAGFGIKTADHVRALSSHADGVIVGSALLEVLEKGQDPAIFLRTLTA